MNIRSFRGIYDWPNPDASLNMMKKAESEIRIPGSFLRFWSDNYLIQGIF